MSCSRDRILDVLNGRAPDRVPYFELLVHSGVIRQMHPQGEGGYQDLRKALSRFKKDRMVAFYSKGTLNRVWYLVGGMEEYLVKTSTESDLVLAMNEMTSELHLVQAQKAMDLGADIIALAREVRHVLPAVAAENASPRGTWCHGHPAGLPTVQRQGRRLRQRGLREHPHLEQHDPFEGAA